MWRVGAGRGGRNSSEVMRRVHLILPGGSQFRSAGCQGLRSAHMARPIPRCRGCTLDRHTQSYTVSNARPRSSSITTSCHCITIELSVTMRLLSRALTRPCLAQRVFTSAATVPRRSLTNNDFFRVSEEVREALQSNKPVVALETTIYTHGRWCLRVDK